MQIETFECETAPASVEFTEEAIALVEKLGASKQNAYYKEGKPPLPYRLMTLEEKAVYEILLPRKDDIKDYDASPIPLRVLQVGAHAKEVLEAGTLMIWHPGVGKDDPLLTLRIGESWASKYYLLARWGEVLEEWPVLFELAVKRQIETVTAAIVSSRMSLEQWQAGASDMVRNGIRKGQTDVPSNYWHI